MFMTVVFPTTSISPLPVDRDVRVVGITADYFSRTRAISIEAKAEEAVKHLPKEAERVLVGFSYAALVAMEIARRTPETSTSLVLIDPYSKFPPKS